MQERKLFLCTGPLGIPWIYKGIIIASFLCEIYNVNVISTVNTPATVIALHSMIHNSNFDTIKNKS